MPVGLRFSGSHEWVFLSGTVARVGISDFAVSEIKDIVYVDLPATGTRASALEPFGAVETVKAAFDLYAPVSGTVKAANQELSARPDLVSQDPFGAGWMIEIEVGDVARAEREMAALMDAAAYAEHCRKQKH
jgi:glycine cleavage system H protein